jgi:hypothetical protein
MQMVVKLNRNGGIRLACTLFRTAVESRISPC